MCFLPTNIYVRFEREYGNEIPLIHRLSPKQHQQYQFTTTISWTFVKSSKELIEASNPTLLFSVPYDILYPFNMNLGTSILDKVNYASLIIFTSTFVNVIICWTKYVFFSCSSSVSILLFHVFGDKEVFVQFFFFYFLCSIVILWLRTFW